MGIVVQFLVFEGAARDEMVKSMGPVGSVGIKDLLVHLGFEERSCWVP